jgi:hypothetical protein
MFANPSLLSLPFYIAGTLKISYDLLLYKGFVAMPPREEASPLTATRFDRPPPRIP